nr:hypothetical protein [Tanacetum cinerariifolium]
LYKKIFFSNNRNNKQICFIYITSPSRGYRRKKVTCGTGRLRKVTGQRGRRRKVTGGGGCRRKIGSRGGRRRKISSRGGRRKKAARRRGSSFLLVEIIGKFLLDWSPEEGCCLF